MRTTNFCDDGVFPDGTPPPAARLGEDVLGGEVGAEAHAAGGTEDTGAVAAHLGGHTERRPGERAGAGGSLLPSQPPPTPPPADHVGRCPWREGSGWNQREGLNGGQGTIRVRGVCLLPDSGGSGRSRRGCRPRSTVGGTWAHGGRGSAGTIWVGRALHRVDCPPLIRPRTGGGCPWVRCANDTLSIKKGQTPGNRRETRRFRQNGRQQLAEEKRNRNSDRNEFSKGTAQTRMGGTDVWARS